MNSEDTKAKPWKLCKIIDPIVCVGCEEPKQRDEYNADDSVIRWDYENQAGGGWHLYPICKVCVEKREFESAVKSIYNEVYEEEMKIERINSNAYFRRLLKKQVGSYELIDEHPVLIQIKKIEILTKRKLKSNI